MATVIISTKKSLNGKKIYHYLEWGRQPGQRITTGIWTHAEPKNRMEKKFNDEQLQILEHKKAEMTIDLNSFATGYVRPGTFEKNFLVFYQAYVDKNKRLHRRHLENSLTQLKKFAAYDDKLQVESIESMSHTKITEDFCKRFRQYLLDRFNGETPQNYFSEFKRVIHAATQAGYFRKNPSENVAAKKNPSKPKDIPTSDEVLRLLEAPCPNQDVKKAFIWCIYTAQAWCDVKKLTWKEVEGDTLKYQRGKSKTYVSVPLHPNAIAILHTLPTGQPDDLVFELPSHTGAKKDLNMWIKNASIAKNITWHSARHYTSVTLQLKGVDVQTVAGILGHSSTQYVQRTYKRYITSAAVDAISRL